MKNRSLLAVVLMLMAGMVFTAGIGSGRVNAQDGDSLTAAVVEGDCGSPGDVAGELRDLSSAEGGVLTSFTRVDIPIGDLTGGGYAVLVSSNGDPAACGDISGDGNDVYVAVTSQSDAGYGGIAWLHARDEQTQVSLFVAQGLGGGGGVEPPGDETPVPPDDETPVPPGDETPQAKPTRTPKAKPTEEDGGGTTYTSPTFGYTVTYDSTWEVLEDTTNPTDNGPQDVLHLFNGTSHAYFYTNAADEDFPMEQLPDVLLGRLQNSESLSNIEVRTDDNGDEIRGSEGDTAFIAVNFTWTNQNGQEYELYDYYTGFRIPGQGAVLIFLNEGLQRAYDQQAPAREKLLNSLEIPQ